VGQGDEDASGRARAERRVSRRSSSSRRSLHEIVVLCRRAAREALARTATERVDCSRKLSDLSNRMTLDVELAGLSRAAREAVGKLDEHVRETQEMLALFLRELDEELRERFAVLEEDADHVTVTVFGKTRTGKSTLLAALVGGSGDGIGTGRQHTTKEIREYFWPPETRELRLVDTPGVEGLNGAELAEKAQRFVERSDHILFMLTDDVQTAGETRLSRRHSHPGKVRHLRAQRQGGPRAAA
jgi:tRNA U34 5-carboxymethylaminomethyl modifying GTPase MnmE/TrmE